MSRFANNSDLGPRVCPWSVSGAVLLALLVQEVMAPLSCSELVDILRRAKPDLKTRTVYGAIKNLEKIELVDCVQGDLLPGTSRDYYRMTTQGKEQARAAHKALLGLLTSPGVDANEVADHAAMCAP